MLVSSMMSIQNHYHNTNREVVISWVQPKGEIQDGYPVLSVPGFRNFMDPKKSSFRKKIWFIIFLCCFCLSVAQISERVQYYLKYPVSMMLSIEKHSEELQFPKIGICNYHGFNSTSILKALKAINGTTYTDLLLYGNMTVEELWDIAGEEFDPLIRYCRYAEDKLGVSLSCKNHSLYWKPKYTIMGKCHVLELTDTIKFYGRSSGILVSISDVVHLPLGPNEHMRWKILLYDDRNNFNYEIFTHGGILYKAARTSLTYWQKRYHYENTPIRPCLPEQVVKECENRCFDLTLLNGKQCKLPFMETVNSFPLCNGEQVAEIYAEYPSSAMLRLDINRCGCGNSCFVTTIDVQPDSRQSFAHYSPNVTMIEIFPSRPETEIIKEVRAYNLPTLFSDIGGALGLYLGTSILTFFEIFETVTRAFIGKLRQSCLHRQSR